MSQEYEFQIPRKDFGRILRKHRIWYLLGMIFLLLLLSGDGIALGLTIRNGVQWWLIALIPPLSISYGVLWFFSITDGGAQVFGDCKAVFDEKGNLTISCRRDYGISPAAKLGTEKTMNIKRAQRDGKYWVVYGDHRLWAVLPADIPLPASVLIETKK